MSKTIYSKCKCYKVFQHKNVWVELYLTTSGSWILQSGDVGQFPGFPWE